MLKKVLSSAVLLAAVNASAGENYFANEWDAKGLIALEGAGSAIDLVYQDTSVTPNTIINDSAGGGAISLQLGGESNFYRLFLATTYYQFDAPQTSSSTATSLGVQLDYLIRAGEHFNIFMGVNGGGIYSDFEYTDGTGTITTESGSDGYGGVQVGVNIDIVDTLGVELGGRVKHVFSTADVYTLDNIYEGYASIVFKFTGEY